MHDRLSAVALFLKATFVSDLSTANMEKGGNFLAEKFALLISFRSGFQCLLPV